MTKKKVLFVAYGGAHVQMTIPVARALQESDWAAPVVLGLTTAATAVRAAGLPLLQFRDFLDPGNAQARQWGGQLLDGMGTSTIDPEESVAYLGLSFQNLVACVGEDEALRRYAAQGRHCFLPVGVLELILKRVAPDLVVSTSAPRAEQAAFIAARNCGIPSLCMIDSFIQDEALRLGAPGYSDALCVLNESVRQTLVHAGGLPDRIYCTGNPAFDTLQEPESAAAGSLLCDKMQWAGKYVVLLPTQTFHDYHPTFGHWSGTDMPLRLQNALVRWTRRQGDVVLCIRTRPGDPSPSPGDDPRIVMTAGSEWPLASLLHAVNLVVTVSSTVGLEGHIAGARVVQVLGTPFDAATPWIEFGIADRAVPLDQLEATLDAMRGVPRRAVREMSLATPRVVRILENLAYARTLSPMQAMQ